MADIVVLESQLQKDECSSKYVSKNKKFYVSYTGLDETKFQNTDLDEHFFRGLKIPLENKTILFRAKFNQEAGYGFLEAVSHSLPENINLIICSGGQKLNQKFAQNVRVVESWLSENQLRTLYLKTDLVLGQLSNHPRLAKTIPHKVYEAAYFGKALLTFPNLGVMEVINRSEAFFLSPSSPQELASTIELLLENPDLLNEYGKRLLEKQNTLISQERIALNFLNIISPFHSSN
jgi:glycosyltransferase involved in cell wall biosynthesis